MGGAASKIAGCTSGPAGSGHLGGSGGELVVEEEYCAAGGGGGGGGYFGGGGGGGGVNQTGGGGGAGSSFVDPEVGKGEVAVNEANERDKLVITYTTPPPPQCTMAAGNGTVNKGKPGRFQVIDALSTDLSDPQKLLVDEQVKAPQFHLLKLLAASCTGAPGERVFQGSGTAIRNSKRGYTVSFSIKEQSGGFFFEAKLTNGSEEIEVAGGPFGPRNKQTIF